MVEFYLIVLRRVYLGTAKNNQPHESGNNRFCKPVYSQIRLEFHAVLANALKQLLGTGVQFLLRDCVVHPHDAHLLVRGLHYQEHNADAVKPITNENTTKTRPILHNLPFGRFVAVRADERGSRRLGIARRDGLQPVPIDKLP